MCIITNIFRTERLTQILFALKLLLQFTFQVSLKYLKSINSVELNFKYVLFSTEYFYLNNFHVVFVTRELAMTNQAAASLGAVDNKSIIKLSIYRQILIYLLLLATIASECRTRLLITFSADCTPTCITPIIVYLLLRNFTLFVNL